MKSSLKARVFSREFALNYGIYGAVIAFVIIMAVVSEYFLTTKNIINIFTQSSVLMILCIGMSLTMLTQGIDMSVGAVMFLCAAVMQRCGTKLDWPILPMCLAGIVVGLICGFVNGLIAAKLNVYPLLTTLASMYACRGIGLSITGGGAAVMPMFWGDITAVKLAGLPLQCLVALLLAVLVQAFLTRTPLGRNVFAVGDSQKTAHEKGIAIVWVKILVYTLSGLMCAIAGIISSSQTMSTTATMGNGSEFLAMIAAVMGGTSMFGGKGSIFPGCLVGALIMSAISNALVLLKAPPNAYAVVYASVIFLVVLLDTVRNRLSKRS